MCCGKSTIGNALAERLNLQFIDLDSTIEKKYEMSIAEQFASIGECEFRWHENHTLIDVLHNDMMVVACGGGTPCFFQNLSLMKQKGIVLFINSSLNAIYNRLLDGQLLKRPMLANLDKIVLRNRIEEQFKSRLSYYMSADIIIDVEDGISINEILDLIINKINLYNNEYIRK